MIGYHYTSQNNFEKIVQKDGIHLWLTDTRFLNDRFELLECNRLFEKVAKKSFDDGKISENVYNDIKSLKASFERIIFDEIDLPQCVKTGEELKISVDARNIHRDMFVCCFSNRKDSLPMWNYYLKNSANGYAIGIDFDKIQHNDCRIIGCEKQSFQYKFMSKPIVMLYSDDKKKEKLEELIDRIVEKYVVDDHLNESGQSKVVQQLTDYSLFFKNNHFNYEKEIRLLVELLDSSDRFDFVKYRFDHGLVIPYFEIVINKEALSAISVSPQIGLSSDSELIKSSIENYLKKQGYTSKININCSEIPLRYY